MYVRMKGLNRVRKRLADGSTVIYFYAWKGGPRLPGKPGAPEFIAAYNEAIKAKIPPRKEHLASIFDGFLDSSEFLKLAEKTRIDYHKHVAALAVDFANFPIAALDDRRTRGIFLAHRDKIALKTARTADYRFAVFARVLSWAEDRGKINNNPLERPGRTYHAHRRDVIWSEDDEAAFYARAPAHLHLALTLALWTGQRQGDLLRLTWGDYNGKKIALKQGKTGARVQVPAGKPLREALDAAKARREVADTDRILTNARGITWTPDGFRTSWGKACKAANIIGVTFHDLRGTAVTRLALAGCSVPEIASITGHAIKDAAIILEAHYLGGDTERAESAIKKLENKLQISQLDSQLGNPA